LIKDVVPDAKETTWRKNSIEENGIARYTAGKVECGARRNN